MVGRPPPFSCRQSAWVIALALILPLLALLLAPGPVQALEASRGEPRALRIVSLAPAITEMLYALDQGRWVVGVSSFCNYPPEVRGKPVVGAATDLNEERLISLRPDLILTVEGDRSRLERLSRLGGVKIVVLRTRHVVDIWENLQTIGRLTGEAVRAGRLVRDLKGRLAARAAAAARRPEHPRVFYMVWDKPLMTAGQDSYLNDLIALAGGRNIVSGERGASYPTYSWEALLAADPEVILGPRNMAGSLAALSQQYPQLQAVRANRIRNLPDDLISRPGPRVVEALQAVEEALR